MNKNIFISELTETMPSKTTNLTYQNFCYQALTSLAPSQSGFLQIRTKKIKGNRWVIISSWEFENAIDEWQSKARKIIQKHHPNVELINHFLASPPKAQTKNTLVSQQPKKQNKIRFNLKSILIKYYELRGSIKRIFQYAQT